MKAAKDKTRLTNLRSLNMQKLCSLTAFCTLYIWVNKESWGLELPTCEKQLGSESLLFFPFNSLKTFCPLTPEVAPKFCNWLHCSFNN